MARALGFAVALVLLLAPAAEAAGQPTGKLRAGAEETVLRLHDLPPGYMVGFDDSCEALEPIGVDFFRRVDRWIAKHWPERCQFDYERRFLAAGYGPAPPQITSETINTPSAKAAAEGREIFLRLIRRVIKPQREATVSIGPGGPTATLFRKRGQQGSLLLWQHGKLLASLEVVGMNAQESGDAALHYAQVQQRRLESPSPYTEAERDDTEVPLDDPSLKVPVYWLGSAFSPEGGPGPAELQTATAIEKGGLPGVKLELRYDGFNLETWTRQSWKRFQGSFFKKLNRPPCTRTTAFEWEQGHAVISAGYRRRTFEDGCPDFPPTRYWAAAHIGGVVVGVNQTTCRCLSPGFGYYSSSLRGMKAILRGLALRPKPVY